MSAYSPAEILECRICSLMTIGFTREEAERLVAETVRPPGA